MLTNREEMAFELIRLEMRLGSLQGFRLLREWGQDVLEATMIGIMETQTPGETMRRAYFALYEEPPHVQVVLDDDWHNAVADLAKDLGMVN
jgi:hypothetical protein